MSDKTKERRRPQSGTRTDGPESEESFRVEDRRHTAHAEEMETDGTTDEATARPPGIIGEYQARAEAAEQKLQEYIEAFKQFRTEQDTFRERLGRDVDRRVNLQFGGLVESLLEVLDNLDLALEHVEQVDEAAPLAKGVELARRSFLETLERNGVERIEPHGQEFDPNDAEALRVDQVTDPSMAGKVTAVLRPGYRLGERVIRPARVAVGRSAERRN